MASVKIMPDEVMFTPNDGETILEAGLRHKLNLPHSCKNGVCSTCRCKVISGDIELEPYNSVVLSEIDKESGYTLLCKAHAKNDVILDIPNLLSSFPIKMLPSKIESITKTTNTAIINLKLPVNQKFDFYAGQYIEIMLQGKLRSYSLANNPNRSNYLELHIRHHPGGLFSDLIWNETLKPDSIIRFKGPFGTFKLQNTDKPIVLVCTGTGFAPIKAILEEMVATNNQRNIYLYWGNRTLADFYLLDKLQELSSQLNIKIIYCLSQEKIEGYFIGYVTTAITKDFTNLSSHELYACGNPHMIADIYKFATKELHLQPQNFFSDAFTPSVV